MYYPVQNIETIIYIQIRECDMGKASSVLNPIDVIAGCCLIIGGLTVILGYANLGAFLGGLGLLVEAIKILFQQGW